MKKTYTMPESREYKIKVCQFMAGSELGSGGDGNGTIPQARTNNYLDDDSDDNVWGLGTVWK